MMNDFLFCFEELYDFAFVLLLACFVLEVFFEAIFTITVYFICLLKITSKPFLFYFFFILLMDLNLFFQQSFSFIVIEN